MSKRSIRSPHQYLRTIDFILERGNYAVKEAAGGRAARLASISHDGGPGDASFHGPQLAGNLLVEESVYCAWHNFRVRREPGTRGHCWSCYDDAFLQRRMDYSPEVTGSSPVAHYTYDYKEFDGFMFPTRRRVYLHDANGIADQTFAPITIEVERVVVQREPADVLGAEVMLLR